MLLHYNWKQWKPFYCLCTLFYEYSFFYYISKGYMIYVVSVCLKHVCVRVCISVWYTSMPKPSFVKNEILFPVKDNSSKKNLKKYLLGEDDLFLRRVPLRSCFEFAIGVQISTIKIDLITLRQNVFQSNISNSQEYALHFLYASCYCVFTRKLFSYFCGSRVMKPKF